MNTGLHNTHNQPGCASTNTCQCKSCLQKKILPTILEEMMLDHQLPVAYNGIKFRDDQKDSLRSQARRGRNRIAKTDSNWVDQCKQRNNNTMCQLHHIIPLQYAHHIKGFNPNRKDNVVLLTEDQHQKIHQGLEKQLRKYPKGSWEWKKELVKFYRKIKRNRNAFQNAKEPGQYNSQSILKELLQELNL